ncbi:MAG TPA: asparagine synthase (glutamine-hydrolyzing) [Vicinamibacteria bacterium]|nr:asparagine synthase (glutamine-hydrolyzing) [Vicinamibacteria bacterium]
MCGIAGFVNLAGEPADASVLRPMVATLRHRGPDAQTLETLGPCGLGHTRLAIIDLSGGNQPMSTDDGLWIVFNGEIYNYLELREELLAKGRRFQTKSDTEVILQAYREYGPDCVTRFNGQFAFALWDTAARTLFLSRDRLGKKPLFYAQRGRHLVFASEMKAVLTHPAVPRELDLKGLDQVLTFWCTVPPRTVFEAIRELPPGHSLLLESGQVRTWPYWQLDYRPDERERTEAEYAEELRALLIDATRLRMLRSDVPVGAYVSGGIDSTVIAALVRKYTDQPLDTFSVTFEDPEYDESAFQRQVVDHLGIRQHRSVHCAGEDIGRVFPDVVWHTEQPIVRTAPAPLFLLSRLVRENGYKVILTGEGSDEVLGGYDIFKEAKVRRFWAKDLASGMRPALLKKLYPYMTNLQSQPPAYLRAFFHVRTEDLSDPFFSHLPRWELTARAKMFYSDEVRSALGTYAARDEIALPAPFAGWDPFCQAQYLETSGLLPGYILSSQGDRMQMANSVEGRCPFLDYRVAEFAGRLPPRLKMKVLNEKYILKRATSDLLPAFLQKRPKQPYRAMEVPSFFDTGKRRARFDWVDEMLSPGAVKEAGLFNPGAVEKLAQKAREGGVVGVKDAMALVSILSTQLTVAQFTKDLRKIA